MKLISLLVAFCFSMNVFASTGSLQELERAIDEYQYAMTVEWDQKDKSFQESQAAAFIAKLGELYKKGLAVEDVNLLIEKRFKNTKISEAVKLKVKMLGQNQSPADLAKVLQENTSEFYSSGASWNGSSSMWVLGGVIAAIIAVSMAYNNWQEANYQCTKYAEAEQCVDEYDCYGESCHYDGTYCSIITRCIKEVRI